MSDSHSDLPLMDIYRKQLQSAGPFTHMHERSLSHAHTRTQTHTHTHTHAQHTGRSLLPECLGDQQGVSSPIPSSTLSIPLSPTLSLSASDCYTSFFVRGICLLPCILSDFMNFMKAIEKPGLCMRSLCCVRSSIISSHVRVLRSDIQDI